MVTTEWIEACAAAAAGLAAVYAAVRGVSEYQDSTRLRKASLLSEIETEFRTVLPTLARIEDDGCFRALDAALAKDVAGTQLTPEEVETVNTLDLVLRFFFILRIKQQWLPELEEMNPVYRYYLLKLRERDSVRAYANQYYRGLLPE